MNISMHTASLFRDFQQPVSPNSQAETNKHNKLAETDNPSGINLNNPATISAIDHAKNLNIQLKKSVNSVTKEQRTEKDDKEKSQIEKLKERLNKEIEELTEQIKHLAKFDNEPAQKLKENLQSRLIQVQEQLNKIIEEEQKKKEREKNMR